MSKALGISVVLPVYEVEDYIFRCLYSLKRQSLKEFEIVVVDDRGADSSIAIASKCAEQDERIRIITNPRNLGTYHARRVGVQNARGRYIVFLDPDDELEDDALLLIYKAFIASDSDLLFYGIRYVPKRKWYVKEEKAFPCDAGDSVLLSYFKNPKANYALGTLGKAFKKDFLQIIYDRLDISRDYRFVFSEDTCLLMAAMLFGPRFYALTYDGYVYHSNPTSITAKNSPNAQDNMVQYEFTLSVLRKLASELDLSVKEEVLVKNLFIKFNSDKHLF